MLFYLIHHRTRKTTDTIRCEDKNRKSFKEQQQRYLIDNSSRMVKYYSIHVKNKEQTKQSIIVIIKIQHVI